MNHPTIAFIFPTFNSQGKWKICVKSILNLNYPVNKIQIIIIDNDSTDKTAKSIKSYISKRNIHNTLYLIRNTSNVGFAKAINKGVSYTKSDLICITNDDVIFDPNSIKILIEDIISNSKIGIIGPRVLSPHGNILSQGHIFNRWNGQVRPAKDDEQVDWIQGCCLLIDRKLFNKIGRLNDKYDHFFEDLEIAYKVKKSGKKIAFNPNAIITHAESSSSNKDMKNKYFLWYKNKIQFVNNNLLTINKISIFLCMTTTILFQPNKYQIFINAVKWNLKK